ncbi:hydrogenase [Rhodospirillum sp. A1_3_36]|uniref:hydrogenase n=1 Tax=Rhodospirillum sp. A1_3_36 TaxID=3391666 RepID=UPI0039A6A027
MSSSLIDRLTDDLGWPRLDSLAALEAHLATPGDHCLFIPGDPVKNLETNDAAVVLPELVRAFQGRFDCAVIAPAIEEKARTQFDCWPTPSLIFLRNGTLLGSIPRVRDWADYLTRTSAILNGHAQPDADSDATTTPTPATAN